MAGIALGSERERVTGQHDRCHSQYENTRTKNREVYLEGLPPSDRNQRNPDRVGLSKREKNAGVRAFLKMIECAGYSKALQYLGTARFPLSENIVDTVGFLTYRNFWNAHFFQNGTVEVPKHWKEWPSGQAWNARIRSCAQQPACGGSRLRTDSPPLFGEPGEVPGGAVMTCLAQTSVALLGTASV